MVKLKLVGSKLIKIEAERNADFSGKLEMKTNLIINSIEKIKEAKETLKLLYNFEIDYGELGKVSVTGNLFLTGDSKPIKDLLKAQKEKKYDTPEYIAITNLIIQKASIKAFELEEELGLPIHIKLPSLSLKN
ncbi:MAG: hypothetical protein OEL89_00450 [Candidatus Peregrinibacteria bacterium]|nr:hypothetical protein [Candidatus Peregrinibacteria bacterium]